MVRYDTDRMNTFDLAYKWKDAIYDRLTSVSVAHSLTAEDRVQYDVKWVKGLEIDFMKKDSTRAIISNPWGSKDRIIKVTIEASYSEMPIIIIGTYFSNHIVNTTTRYYTLEDAMGKIDEVFERLDLL